MKRGEWTQEHSDQLRAMRSNGISIRLIAEQMGLSMKTVYTRMAELNLLGVRAAPEPTVKQLDLPPWPVAGSTLRGLRLMEAAKGRKNDLG